MTRYRGYGNLDDPMQEVGDTGFAALASRDELTQLQAGVVSESKNIRLDDARLPQGLDTLPKLIFKTCLLLRKMIMRLPLKMEDCYLLANLHQTYYSTVLPTLVVLVLKTEIRSY